MNYRIVVPSRKRSYLMKHLNKILPEATITVNKEEIEDYKKTIGEKQTLVPHPSMDNQSIIRQWIYDNFDEETIIVCDDDLAYCRCIVGERERKIHNWEKIKTILENSINISRDLDISLFYWNRNPDPMLFYAHDFIHFSGGFAAGIYGLNGRKIKHDKNVALKADIDITLTAMLEDRIVFTDKRFYFHFEGSWVKEGGLQGIRTEELIAKDSDYLMKKWGKKYIEFKKQRGYQSVVLTIPRRMNVKYE